MFRGQFKFKNSQGNPYTYSSGDVIVYQGKMYECLSMTQQSPLQNPVNWRYTNITENFISENPPLNPKEGQIWTSSNGISYTWFVDNTSSQWVQT